VRHAVGAGAGVVIMLLCGALPPRLAGQECQEGGPPGAVIRGVVVDSVTRVPLQQADVRLTWSADDGSQRGFELEADSAGRFRLCRLPTGRTLTLRADFSEPGLARQVRVAPADSASVELEAKARHSQLRGQVVTSAGEPLASAEVQVLGTPLRAVTNERGEFEFPRIPPGAYLVLMERLGYGRRTASIEVDFRSTVELKAALAASAVKLPPLIVDVRSQLLAERGFYDRRERGPGAFLTRQQWEKRSPAKPSDVLRTVPGVTVQPVRGGFDNVVLDRRGCAMRYFVDGVRTNATFRLDELNVQDIEALEIYRGPSEVPAQFTAFSSAERGTCGVIVVWTRMR